MKKYTSGAFESTTYSIYTRSSEEIITEFPAIITTTSQNTIAIIKGNMVQTGTPSPSSIIMPDECGDKTANLCNVQSFTITAGGGSYNTVIFSGTLVSGTYTISLNQDNALTSSLRNTIRVNANGTTYYESTSTNYHNEAGLHSYTFTVNETSNVEIWLWSNTFSNSCTYSNIMLNTGSTPLPYQPYGYKIPISSGGTTTNVYLGEVASTRQIKQIVLTGEENYTESTGWKGTNTSVYYVGASGTSVTYAEILSTSSHFQGVARSTLQFVDTECTCMGNNIALFRIKSSIANDATEFKQWVAQQYAADTPVCVWYVLATPQTTTLNEPIRKIGNYADSVSVTGIPTTAEEQFDIDTTLKPSEVDLLVCEWTESQDKIYPWGETNAKVLRRKKSAKSKT